MPRFNLAPKIETDRASEMRMSASILPRCSMQAMFGCDAEELMPRRMESNLVDALAGSVEGA